MAGDLGIDVAADEAGAVTFATPMPDGAEEWISQNRALRELVSDVLENAVDPIGYRYRTIADALPDLVTFEPRVYTSARSGALEVNGADRFDARPNGRGRARSKPIAGSRCACTSTACRVRATTST